MRLLSLFLYAKNSEEKFCKKIKSIKITDLAKSITKSKYKVTGIRPGEKIHEQMIGSDESTNTAEFKHHYEILANFKEKNLRLKKCENVDKNFIFHPKQQKNSQLMNLKK